MALQLGKEMLDRLNWMTIKPKKIIETWARLPEISTALQQQFPDSKITRFNEEWGQADFKAGCKPALSIPMSNHSVQMIFANYFLPWQKNFKQQFKEWRRVLQENGLLIFSAFGPDTLLEWREQLKNDEIPQFIDMHDLGDMLIQAGFIDPVIEVDHIVVSYRDQMKLVNELIAAGMWFPENHEQISELISAPAENLQTTYEIIIAHAYAATPKNKDAEQAIPLQHIRKVLRNT